MGYEGDTTPTLDELAADGIVFENAIAPGPNTPSSMPSVFTGEHIFGIDRGIAMRDRIRKHVSRTPTIAERLSKRGYTTVGFTTNPFTSRHFGFDAGFDEFTDFLSTRNRLSNRIVSRWMKGEFIAGLRFGINMLGYGDLSTTWEEFYDDVVSTLRTVEEPFFLWIFLLEPHWPYYPPKRFRDDASLFEMYYHNWVRSKLSNSTPGESGTERLRSLYDGTIRHVDEFFERLATDLRSRDPVFVFHSDHGEAFGERGLYGHGQYLYEENIHVPLVIGNVDRATGVEEPISIGQLPAMIMDIADGSSELEADSYTRPWVPAYAAGKEAIRGAGWKCISESDEREFYDLRTDPGEQNGSADERVIRALERVVTHHRSDKDERTRITQATDDMGIPNL